MSSPAIMINDPPAPAVGEADRLKILMVAARYYPFMGGIETHIHEVSRRMVALGHEVHLVTTDPKGTLPEQEDVDGVQVTRVPAWPRQRDYYFAPSIWKHFKRINADILHIQGYHTLVPPLAIAAALRLKLPFVISFHSGGHSLDWRNKIRGMQQRALAPLFRRADHWIGVSEFEADHFSKVMNIPRENFTVVPNGAQLPVPSGTAGQTTDPEAPLILSIGRLERYKGHHRAITAFPHVLKRYPRARLRVLGEGPYKEELIKLVQKMGLSEQVEVGGIPSGNRQDMADLLVSASLVVLLSDYEAHPVAVTEALSLKRPILGTNTSGCGELAAKGLIASVELGASDEDTADAMIETMTNWRPSVAINLPNWDDCTEQLMTIYRHVVESKALSADPQEH